MAKGNSKGGSAQGTPSSLTTLLAPTVLNPTPSLLTWYAREIQAFNAEQQIARLDDILASEDRRTYHPAQQRPAGALIRRATRLVVSPTHSLGGAVKNKLPAAVQFAQPRAVAICVRRRARREVLHALRLTKRGSGSGTRRRNTYSKVKC